MGNKQFTWIPFYEEFANKLLEYKGKRKELVEIVYSLEGKYVNYIHNDDGSNATDIDPFSVFAIFNRGVTDENRKTILSHFKNKLGITTDLPHDYDGVPILNAQQSIFFGRDTAGSQIPDLWNLFESAINGNQPVFEKFFDNLQHTKGIKWNITIGLFWIRPNKYMPLDGNSRTYLSQKGISIFPEKEITANNYLNLLKDVQNGFSNNIFDEKSLVELSYSAWKLSKNDKGINQVIQNDQLNTLSMQNNMTNKLISLLRSNHNLILTGAPGTGKTYLAKQIAKKMGCTDDEIGFVQFHPSYDYTDFVEGLRPKQDNNGNVVFEREDGVFKKFCAKALENLLDSQKSEETLQKENSVRKLLEDFLQDAIDSGKSFETKGTGNVFQIIDNKAKTITIDIPKNERARIISLPKSDLITLLENNANITGSRDLQSYFNRKYRTQQDSYTFVLYEILMGMNANDKTKAVSLVKRENYVFIIDEINRGEISKIFGELFFSIDPGYRGTDGKVKTQYANMQEDPNDFDEALGIKESDNCGWFFVPENVYIIGTMNDIDRSVESMDFAFRRRFAFVEIKADENVGMLDDLKWKDEAIKRMKRLNEAISQTDGLSSAYHIGASYFLKLKNYNGDFNQLWEYHLEGLLREYLRGMQGVEDSMKKLKNAYDNANPTDGQQQ